jgi:hypothetical protein
MPEKLKLEAQLLSQAAERTLSAQLDEAEQINIDVQTDIGKIVQGQVDTVALAGQGLVIQEEIRVQEIHLLTDSININPLRAIFGQIQLNAPVNTVARIVITQADINRAFNSGLIRRLSQNLELQLDGQTIGCELKQMQVLLHESKQIECRGQVLIKESDKQHLLEYIAMIKSPVNARNTSFKSFHCIEGGGIALDLIARVMQKFKALLNTNYFEWEEMAFSIKDMSVDNGNLILLVEATVKQIPTFANTFTAE